MASPPNPDLFDSCLTEVEQLNQEKQWKLPPDGCMALARAVLPWAIAASADQARDLRIIVQNYYFDGILVEELRVSELSIDASEAVQQWRNFTVAVVLARFQSTMETAEDIAQECWLDVLRAVRDRKFHFRSRFKTFLYSVVIHRGQSMFRREKAERHGGKARIESLERADESHGIVFHSDLDMRELEDEIVYRNYYQLVSEAIERYRMSLSKGKISPQTKERLYRWVLLEGVGLQEAAQELGLNYDTAATLVHRLRGYLRRQKELQDNLEELPPN